MFKLIAIERSTKDKILHGKAAVLKVSIVRQKDRGIADLD